jgi:hypothetical protein
MKQLLLLTFLLSISFENAWSQNNFKIEGKWTLDKIKLTDTVIIAGDRFFSFNENMYEFGKIKKSAYSQGKYHLKGNSSITFIPNHGNQFKGTFSITLNANESLSLNQDSLTLYLTRYYSPSDFVQNPIESKIEEVKGWNYFKIERFDSSLHHFQQAYFTDSTNYDAMTGLIYSKGAAEGKIDFELIRIITEKTKTSDWGIGMSTAAFVNRYSNKADSINTDDNLNPQIISALYTGSEFLIKYPNGKLKESGAYRNKKPIGPWTSYRSDGTKLRSIEYNEIDTMRIYTFHKEDGEMVRKEIFKVDGNKLTTMKIITYYQELPDKKGTYLYVSKTGFCTYQDGNILKFDNSTPDNVIEEVPDLKKGKIWYIWKSGKRTIYRECELDGKIIWEYQSEKPGKYIWENCKKKFLEPIK